MIHGQPIEFGAHLLRGHQYPIDIGTGGNHQITDVGRSQIRPKACIALLIGERHGTQGAQFPVPQVFPVKKQCEEGKQRERPECMAGAAQHREHVPDCSGGDVQTVNERRGVQKGWKHKACYQGGRHESGNRVRAKLRKARKRRGQ